MSLIPIYDFDTNTTSITFTDPLNLGAGAGVTNQGAGAIAIGTGAGATNQGAGAIAIGLGAASTNQTAGSIAITTGAAITASRAGLYINPVRYDGTNALNVVYYNSTTSELTYATAPQPYALPVATDVILGGVVIPLVATSGITNNNGTIGLAVASTTQKGAVKVDGTTITINNGIISANISANLPTATTSTLGAVKVDGTSVKITNGVISTGTLTASQITTALGYVPKTFSIAMAVAFG